MFYALHRIYVVTWAVAVCAGLIWLYPRSGVSGPVGDWYAVWKNHGKTTVRPVGELSGSVIKVLDGTSFTLRADDRQLYNIALLGVAVSGTRSAPGAEDPVLTAKGRLSELVLSNAVAITLTWLDPQRRGVGIVHCNGVNVNAEMVESGLVEFKREFIKGAPLLDQYALMRAERKAREAVAVP